MNSALDGLRRQLDQIDDQLLELLAARRGVVDRVAAVKAQQGVAVRDRLREAEIFARLCERAGQLGLERRTVAALLRRVLADSVRRQQQRLAAARAVTFQGAPGAWSEAAARRFLAPRGVEATLVGCITFRETLEAVARGAALLAVVPVENSIVGAIPEVPALIAELGLSVVGEQTLEIEHCLLGLEQRGAEGIARVLSHPVALAQCSRFLGRLRGCQIEAVWDTAGAARLVRDGGDPAVGAIASEAAGERWGLAVLARGIADRPENRTRFLVVARPGD
ncbi:MAG TPA: prephenate dehydratase domain-containing protein [Thermoanaerobaculia bacterium]|nr:prephenate dehydratase domain-containing protein [Thermoanaerobaculia bacterium]